MSAIISISPSDVILMGRGLLDLRNPRLFRDAFGAPSRWRDIKMHPSGTRVAMVWDSLGLVAYEDQPDASMSHLHIAFDSSETPEHPMEPSTATIVLNGTDVTADTTERTLPKTGSTPIIASFGKRYYFECGQFVVDFHFEKRRDDRSRKIGTPRLAYLSFSWCSPISNKRWPH